MKNLLISIMLAFGLATAAFAQAPLNPFNGSQQMYVDANGHSVPYFLAFPLSGVTTLVFDPSTSATDQINAFRHAQKASSETPGAPQVVSTVLPGIVGTQINSQETRTGVPFGVTASTTLQTIPFNLPTILQTNGHYRFEARLYTNEGGGGGKIDVGGTCTTSNFVAAYKAYSTTTILYGGQLTSFLSGPSGSATAGTFIEIVGELDVTNGGTFVIQFAQSSSNATVSTILAGSTLTVIQIP